MTSEFAIAVHALVFLDRSNATIASEELADNIFRIAQTDAKLKGIM